MNKELNYQDKTEQTRKKIEGFENSIKGMEENIDKIDLSKLEGNEKRNAERLIQDSKNTISRFQEYIKELKEEIKREKHNENSKKYRNANREKIRENDKKYYARNREKEIERSRQYRNANREEINKRRRERFK